MNKKDSFKVGVFGLVGVLLLIVFLWIFSIVGNSIRDNDYNNNQIFDVDSLMSFNEKYELENKIKNIELKADVNIAVIARADLGEDGIFKQVYNNFENLKNDSKEYNSILIIINKKFNQCLIHTNIKQIKTSTLVYLSQKIATPELKNDKLINSIDYTLDELYEFLINGKELTIKEIGELGSQQVSYSMSGNKDKPSESVVNAHYVVLIFFILAMLALGKFSDFAYVMSQIYYALSSEGNDVDENNNLDMKIKSSKNKSSLFVAKSTNDSVFVLAVTLSLVFTIISSIMFTFRPMIRFLRVTGTYSYKVGTFQSITFFVLISAFTISYLLSKKDIVKSFNSQIIIGLSIVLGHIIGLILYILILSKMKFDFNIVNYYFSSAKVSNFQYFSDIIILFVVNSSIGVFFSFLASKIEKKR